MNERLKELAVQAGLEESDVHGDWSSLNYPDVRGADLERFAELVRQDERDKCAADYLQDCCDAVDAARLEGIKACVELLDDFSKTQMVPAKDTWRMGVMAAANAVRDKK
jgi:hypothetical protein